MIRQIGATLEGGCACGAVRYRMLAQPIFVHCCHCTSCQRESGSAFAVNAMIEADQVELLQGELEQIDTPTESGDPQKFFRCVSCKIAVWGNYAMAVGDRLRFVRVGTLDEPGLVPPDVHIFTRSKPPWLPLPADAPAFEVYYDRDEVWPAESLKRFYALMPE